MKGKLFFRITVISLVLLACLAGQGHAEDFRIAIMQDQKDSAEKYKPLFEYLASKGTNATFIPAEDYPSAARMFVNGEVDAMFSGSGVACAMILKGIAYPVVRPVATDETSTYWAVILAPAGSPPFRGAAEYFRGKRVAFSGLASAGEFFFRSLDGSLNVDASMILAASHGMAIDILNNGAADMAIVKNRVWDSVKDQYPGIVAVGEDHGENPNDTLIASRKSDTEIVVNVTAILLGLKDDDSPLARAAKESLGIREYIVTSAEDFKHTTGILKKAGVTKDFDFKFQIH